MKDLNIEQYDPKIILFFMNDHDVIIAIWYTDMYLQVWKYVRSTRHWMPVPSVRSYAQYN